MVNTLARCETWSLFRQLLVENARDKWSAYAALADAPILLFDEATSALDSESEAKVQEATRRLLAEELRLSSRTGCQPFGTPSGYTSSTAERAWRQEHMANYSVPAVSMRGCTKSSSGIRRKKVKTRMLPA